MLTIPIRVDAKVADIDKAFRDLENGIEDAFRSLIQLDGKQINIRYNFASNGEKVASQISDQEALIDKLLKTEKKQIVVQKGSLAQVRESVRLLTKQRDSLNRSNPAWTEYSNKVRNAQAQLRALQGIQSGSIADIRQQKSELLSLKEAVRVNSPEFQRLSGEIKKLDDQLTQTTSKQVNFRKILGDIAVFSAAFAAVSGSIRAIGNALGVYVTRTKEVESFNLAIRNVGITQAETSRIFKQAETTANSLGAPLQQVEKSYKRMVPALRAVGATSDETDKFVASVSARTQTLGLNTEQSGRLLEAFAQVLSKGKLQAEELNQQISELDGAFRTQFADALGVTTEALNELISQSQITADIFVKTVNKMENGVEALQRRVKNGNLTIQQFQNVIQNLETKNIENIGKQLEPAVRAFLRIRLAIAEFVKEFQKTAAFSLLVTIFNQTSKGIETLIKNILSLINAISTLLSPILTVIDSILKLDAGFGGLIGIVINAAAAFYLVGKAIAAIKFVKGIKALQDFGAAWKATSTQVRAGLPTKGMSTLVNRISLVRDAAVGAAEKVSGLNLQFAKSEKAISTLGPAKAKYGETARTAGAAAAGASVGVSGFGAAVSSIINPVTIALVALGALIETFAAAGRARQEVKNAYSGVFDTLEDDLADLKPKVDELPESFEEAAGSVQKSADSANTAGQAWRVAGLIFAGVGIALVTVATGGLGAAAAFAVYAGAVGATVATVKSFQNASEELKKSSAGKQLLEEFKEFDKNLGRVKSSIKGLGGEIGQINFTKFAEGSVNLAPLSKGYKIAAAGLREFISTSQEQIKTERAKEQPNKAAIQALQIKIAAAKQELALTEASVEAISQEIVARIKAGDAASRQTASIEELQKAYQQANQEIDIALIEAQTEAIQKYGKAANAASLMAAANIGSETAASQQRQRLAERDIALLEQRRITNGRLTDEELDQLRELTQVAAEERNRQAQLGIDARNAVIDAFEAGIDRANQKVDILAGSASKLKTSFDGVAGGLTSGLQAATGLIDEVVSRELKGLDVGSAKRVQIIQRQLRAQAVANNVENRLAQLKLSVQNKIATSQARIDQLRFQNEARIAQARGQNDIAAAFREAANTQNQVIQGLNTQFKIESQVLAIQKATKDQKLINKGLDEKIRSDARNVADAIGVQVVNLDQAEQRLVGMIRLTNKYSQDMAKSATSAQDNAEAAQKTSLRSGVEDAKAIENALDGAQGAAEGLGAVMSAANTSFVDVENTTQRIAGYIEVATKEAGKLQRIIIGGGAPARAMGGPVTGGKQYTVNDGGGREGFLSNAGKFSMLPAARNMKWTAPASGTVIPANMVGDFISSINSDRINKASALSSPRSIGSGVDSGNLVKQMTAAMSASGGNQRITNNVTIQSQQPVTDASQIMTNVARMRLRNARRI